VKPARPSANALPAAAVAPTEQVIGQVFEQETSEAEVRDDQKLVGPVNADR
jgi:hypothetical protein